MANLVYILSAGHSGSTLLDMLIGSLPKVFSTGECTYFSWQLYRDGKMCKLGQDICSCGKRFSECSVWRKVIERLNSKVGYNIFEFPFHFDVSILRPQEYGKKYKKVDRIIRAYYNRIFYRKSVQFLNLTPYFYYYLKKKINNNWLLFDTIEEILNVSHIVDSSKDLIRIHFLHYHRPSSTKVIILIRDILGIAGSAVKRGKDPIKTAKDWVKYYELIIGAVGKAFKNALLVKYEELASQPQLILSKIAKFIDKRFPDNINLTEIDTHKFHLIAGNPMRYKGVIRVKLDMSWKKLLSSDQISLIQKLGRDVFYKLKNTKGIIQ